VDKVEGRGMRNPTDRKDRTYLTGAQLKKVWAVSHELGWDSERLHRHVDLVYGKRSLRDLSVSDAKVLIDEMERWVRRQARTNRDEHGRAQTGENYRRPGMGVDESGSLTYYATPAQVATMRAIAGRIGWGQDWIRRVATRVLNRPVTDLARLRPAEAAKMINVVEGLVRSRELKQKQLSLAAMTNDEVRMTNEGEG